MIAVDMDGTFLNDKKEYNHSYFKSLFNRMQKQGLEFVVASGNQYYQLTKFFEPIKDRITFVSQNGGNIYLNNKPFYHSKIERDVQKLTLKILQSFNCPLTIACGFQSAYVPSNVADQEFRTASFYFPKIKKVSSLENLKDDVIMYSLNFPNTNLDEVISKLQAELGDKLKVVATGGNGIDLLIPKIHKASGIKMVQQQLNISNDEVAAFGDSGNDIEMLSHAKYSFAMENGMEEVKKVASEVIGNNNEDSVLKTIDRILKENEES